MKKKFVMSLCLFCLILSTNALAVTAETKVKPEAAAIDSPMKSKQLVFSGTVKKMDEGTALFTEKSVYPLTGGEFDMIVGKKVNIIGKLVKENNIDKIEVARVQFERS